MGKVLLFSKVAIFSRCTAYLKGDKNLKEKHKKNQLCDSFKFYYPTLQGEIE